MGNPNNYPTRYQSWQARADKLPPGGTVANATPFAGGPPVNVVVGTSAVLASNFELPADRFVSPGHLTGTTAQRPNALTDGDMPGPLAGMLYLDTTLSKAILHDGVNWRDVFSGAIV